MSNYHIQIINDVDGIQKKIVVGDGGGITDDSRLIYDSRVHGLLSADLESQIGGLSRSGLLISFDPSAKAVNDGKLISKNIAEAAKETKKADRKAVIKALKNANNLNELKAVIKALAEHIGLEVD